MTNNQRIVRINMADALAPRISARAAIQAFKTELESMNATGLILDFSSVESVSRSAAHELIITRFDLTNISRKPVSFEHMNQDVSRLFETVTDNAINTKPKDRIVSTRRVRFEELARIIADQKDRTFLYNKRPKRGVLVIADHYHPHPLSPFIASPLFNSPTALVFPRASHHAGRIFVQNTFLPKFLKKCLNIEDFYNLVAKLAYESPLHR